MVPWLGRWFFTSLIDGAQQVLVENEYDVLLYDVGGTDEADRRILDTKLLSKRVDALLVLSVPLTTHEVTALKKLHRPVVVVGPTVPDRQLGYERALRTCGIEPDPCLVWPPRSPWTGGMIAATYLVARPNRPTAVVAWSDEIAMGVLYALRRTRLRVPQDVSVIGVDDHDLSRLFDLTTVAQPVREQGRVAAGLLVERLTQSGAIDGQVATVTAPIRLVVRATTGPPPPI